MRRTLVLVQLARFLMRSPNDRHWGYGISRKTGLGTSALYPLLTRLCEAGWLVSSWEDPETIAEKRPPRRYYQVTELGKRELTEIIKG